MYLGAINQIESEFYILSARYLKVSSMLQGQQRVTRIYAMDIISPL